MLISLNKNICQKELHQILKIILTILDQETEFSKNDNAVVTGRTS